MLHQAGWAAKYRSLITGLFLYRKKYVYSLFRFAWNYREINKTILGMNKQPWGRRPRV